MNATAKRIDLGALRERIDAYSPRERLLLLATAAAVVLLLWHQALHAPLARQAQALEGRITALQTETRTLSRQLAVLAQQAGVDPAGQRRAEIAALRGTLGEMDERLRAMTAELVSPREMVAVLEHITRREQGLRLLRLETTGAEPARDFLPGLMATGTGEAAEQAPPLYRHGLVVELEGDYFAILRYLRELEGLSWKFIWEAVELSTEDYPTVEARLRVHTLSFSEGWIGV